METDHVGDIPTNMTTDEISSRDKKLNNDYSAKINVPRSACVLNYSDSNSSSENHTQHSAADSHVHNHPRTFPTILKMVVGSVRNNIFSNNPNILDDEEDSDDSMETPNMNAILTKAREHHGIELDYKQTKAYEMICATFMIKIIRERTAHLSEHDHPEQLRTVNEVVDGLKSLGGKDQLIMFLTGPAGAGKTTSIKLAQTFCQKFSEACHISFDQYSFYFTAYTGAAASEYGGVTTLTALQVPMYGDIGEIKESTASELNRVKILVIDEISFMSVKHLQLISKRLQELFDCASPFGGMSIIFSGDFRQLEHGQGSEDQKLYTTHSNMYFENALNAALILENKHRFREDPMYGKMMSDMWFGDLSMEQKEEINKRVLTDKRKIPNVLEDDCHYACPTNCHRNIISANNFRRHIMATHRYVKKCQPALSHTTGNTHSSHS